MSHVQRADVPGLLTYAPMIDSELARRVLGHYALPYAEHGHLFGWASVLALFHGGYGRLPVFHDRRLSLSGSARIVAHFDPLAPPERRLLPEEPVARAAVEAEAAAYGDKLANAVAVVCYRHMLPERVAMIALFERTVPPGEARLVATIYPALQWLIGLLLRISRTRYDRALIHLRATCDAVEQRLTDGRAFLGGDRMTIADLSLAATLAPLVLPPGYHAAVPAYDVMPPPLRAIVDELRFRPAGTFVARIYQN